jgi:drug/metabolite transporter (DMT)-like permease
VGSNPTLSAKACFAPEAMTTVVDTLYSLVATAFGMLLVWPFFFLAGRHYFHPSFRRLPRMAALYTLLIFASWAMYQTHMREPMKLVLSLATIAVVAALTDWLVFRRQRHIQQTPQR